MQEIMPGKDIDETLKRFDPVFSNIEEVEIK